MPLHDNAGKSQRRGLVMNFLPEKFTAVAKTFPGLEPALEKELAQLKFENIETHNRAVSFSTDIAGLYKVNLALRSALHVLVPLAEKELGNAKDLYKVAYKIEWENIFKTTDKFSVASVVFSSMFKHSNYPALLVKDAIADRFREKLGARPNVDKKNPDVVVTVHVFGSKAEIFLDSSGASLHKRGYRLAKVEAPLNETLAAGLILLSDWDKLTTFIDPMCGSGTIVIEAAMYARNIPPNLHRKNFAFRNWKNFDLTLFTKIKNSLKKEKIENDVKIIANDINPEAIQIASENARRAGVTEFIEFRNSSFFDFQTGKNKKFLIFNPPYDKRLEIKNSVEFYREIGNKLKNSFSNSTVWIFSGNKKGMKQIGLSASRKIVLNNGGMESFFRKYEIYEGSKKSERKNGQK